MKAAKERWEYVCMLGVEVVIRTVEIRRHHADDHQVGGGQDQDGGRLLHRRRRHYRLPERPGDCRRLHVGRLLPGDIRPGVHLRLRRPDLFDRLPGRLADHPVPDGDYYQKGEGEWVKENETLFRIDKKIKQKFTIMLSFADTILQNFFV